MNESNSTHQSIWQRLLHPAVISSVAVAAIAAFQVERVSQTFSRALFPPAPAPVTEVKSLLVNRLQGKTELTTAEVQLETLVTSEEERRLGPLYLGETRVIYEGVGRVKAGLDLSQIEVKSVDRQTGSIQVLLPPPYLIQSDLDVSRSGILEHHRAWLAPNVETTLYTQAQRKALRQIQQEACQEGLLQKANQEAIAILRQVLTAAEYEEISIQTQLDPAGDCPQLVGALF